MTSAPSPIIVFLNLPPKTFIGIDLTSFNSSPTFHGIKNLPAGLHFVYTGTDASLSIRHGRWLDVRRSLVHVLQWDNSAEHLDILNPDSDTVKNVIKTLPELQKRGLVDYTALRNASVDLLSEQRKGLHRAEDAQAEAEADADGEDNEEDEDEEMPSDDWTALTSHLSPRLLSRVLASGDSSTKSTLTSISSAPGDTEHIPGLSSSEVSDVLAETQTLNLLAIDLKQTWREGAQGRERTDMARDRSWFLSDLINTLRSPSAGLEQTEISQQQAARELLGEIQFTFLMVLCLANYSCLEQWKRILSVLFTCRTALAEVEGYFVEAIKVLRTQLGRVDDVEGGLFELADETQSKWLRQLLHTARNNVDEVFTDAAEDVKRKSAVQGKALQDALAELEKWLREEYGWEDERNVLRRGMVQLEDGEMIELQADGWDEEDELGEYAPVIVET